MTMRGELAVNSGPVPLRDHHEPAAAPGPFFPQAADQPVILGIPPAIRALVFDRQNRRVRQLAQEVRVEAAISFLQEERAALLAHQVAHPEIDAAFLRLGIQPGCAFKLFAAVEIADAPVVVPAKGEMTKAPVVIAAGRVAVRRELKGQGVIDRDPCFPLWAEQGLLISLAGSGGAQFANPPLQQVANDELLPIGPRQRIAVPRQQFLQPAGDERLL